VVKKVKAKLGSHVWRRDDATGPAYALELSAAGVKTIAVDETEAVEAASEISSPALGEVSKNSEDLDSAVASAAPPKLVAWSVERVTVVDDGFAWNGATYASASAVAFAITGTKWSGHRFFAVRHRDGVRASECQDDAKRTDGRERRSVLGRGKPINRPLAECDRSSPSVDATTNAGERRQ
jgi:hypothetical protein